MMGRKHREQASLFYEFRLDDMIPKGHLLRRINVFVTSVLGDLHEQLGPVYSDIGRPSIGPELLIRMLIIGYCFGIRSERKLCEEVRLHLAYRWFCRLDLNDSVPHHLPAVERPQLHPRPQAPAEQPQPGNPGMGGFRHRALHVEMKHRLGAASALLGEPPPASIAGARGAVAQPAL